MRYFRRNKSITSVWATILTNNPFRNRNTVWFCNTSCNIPLHALLLLGSWSFFFNTTCRSIEWEIIQILHRSKLHIQENHDSFLVAYNFSCMSTVMGTYGNSFLFVVFIMYWGYNTYIYNRYQEFPAKGSSCNIHVY